MLNYTKFWSSGSLLWLNSNVTYKLNRQTLGRQLFLTLYFQFHIQINPWPNFSKSNGHSTLLHCPLFSSSMSSLTLLTLLTSLGIQN